MENGFSSSSSPSSSSSSTDDPGLKVKVQSLKSGVLRRVKMLPKDTFRLVYDVMASQEGVAAEDIRLTLRDSAVVIKSGDTYVDHGLTICDIVECVVIGQVCVAYFYDYLRYTGVYCGIICLVC